MQDEPGGLAEGRIPGLKEPAIGLAVGVSARQLPRRQPVPAAAVAAEGVVFAGAAGLRPARAQPVCTNA